MRQAGFVGHNVIDLLIFAAVAAILLVLTSREPRQRILILVACAGCTLILLLALTGRVNWLVSQLIGSAG
jgi:hypothetical protein